MGIRVLIIIAILCMSGCKTKEKTVETKVDLQQHTWQYDKSQLKLDETITLFDILINDSDTIATPKKMIRRRANIQQEDTTQKIMYFTQNKKVRSGERPISSPNLVLDNVLIIGAIGVLLLLILGLYLKFWS